MRIAHINLARTFRGGERQTELLARALAAHDVEQFVVVRRGSALATALRQYELLQTVEVGKPFVRHLPLLRSADVLHAHEGRAAQLAFLACCLQGARYLVTRRIPKVPKNNVFTHGVYRRARVVVAISEAIAGIVKTYEPRSNLRVIPSMTARFKVDVDEVRRIRETYRGRFIVGHVGALVARDKGQQYTLEAARRLRDRVPEMLFLMLGEGSDEQWLKRSASDLDNVQFLGFKRNVADYIAALDVFLFPSLREGLGSSLLDAMDLARPIVATEVDGIPEIVRQGHNGILIPARSSAAIVHAVLDLYRSQALRTRLADNARNDARAFYPDSIVKQYLHVYSEIKA